MTHPSELKIEDFDYDLPDERIARFPLKNRSDSKLLVYNKTGIRDLAFPSIVDEIPADSVLVYNNTKVFFARLNFQKSTGANIEVFCLEPYQMEINEAMQAQNTCTWSCMVGNAKRWKDEELVLALPNEQELRAKLKGKNGNDYLVELNWSADISFSELMEKVGNVPLPPYLKRKAEESDKSRYQTVYSKNEGSVAAPTAGLHFTDEILERLKDKGVQLLPLTLHVGAGTFQPVKSEAMKDHDMHAESFAWKLEDLKLLQNAVVLDKTIVAVGTTSLRALESLTWINPDELDNECFVDQWTPYEEEAPPLHQQLDILIQYLEQQNLSELRGKTQIIIAPGYDLQIARGLVTNFHQPKSTLLLLISAIVGQGWREIYGYAMAKDFRFLSYGDSSLLWLTKA